MIEVEQTRSGETIGNCMEAAIASILEIPIETIPSALGAADYDVYLRRLNYWLSSTRRLWLWSIPVFNVDAGNAAHGIALSGFDLAPPTLWIAGVQTVSPICAHALVCRGRRVVWDPSPNRARPEIGLVGNGSGPEFVPFVEWAHVFLPTDLAR